MGYLHELGTTRLPARHAREHAPGAGGRLPGADRAVRSFTGSCAAVPNSSWSISPRPLRLLDFLSRPLVTGVTTGGVGSPGFHTRSIRCGLSPGRATVSSVPTASVPATSGISSLKSHTPHDHSLRFVVVVTFHDATLVTRQALSLTWTGLLNRASPVWRTMAAPQSSLTSSVEQTARRRRVGVVRWVSISNWAAMSKGTHCAETARADGGTRG